MTNDKKAGEVLDVLGDTVAKLAPVVGGKAGLAMLGGAAIVRGAAKLLGAGHSVEQILSKMRELPELVKPWREPSSEDTQPQTPSAKKREE